MEGNPREGHCGLLIGFLRHPFFLCLPSFSFSIKAVISANGLVTVLCINYEFRSFFHVVDQLKTFTLPYSSLLRNVEVTADLKGKKDSLSFAFFGKHTIILVHNF